VRIGVVIPAYNVACRIGGAAASVLAQTHADWRLVVVDHRSAGAPATWSPVLTIRRFAIHSQIRA